MYNSPLKTAKSALDTILPESFKRKSELSPITRTTNYLATITG
jgi:hypothetical protein